jgi:excisionase family DNA binding protein
MITNSNVKLLTIKEAAKAAKLHENTIRNLISRQQLKALRIGRSIRIEEEALLNLLTPYEGGEFGVWKKSAISR